MTATIQPLETYTFTVRKVPSRPQDRKTIQRLMRMQPAIVKGLKALQKKRRREDNVTYIRAGVEWTNRARATKLTRVERGATFTLRVAPQIIPDLNAVASFLDVNPA